MTAYLLIILILFTYSKIMRGLNVLGVLWLYVAIQSVIIWNGHPHYVLRSVFLRSNLLEGLLLSTLALFALLRAFRPAGRSLRIFTSLWLLFEAYGVLLAVLVLCRVPSYQPFTNPTQACWWIALSTSFTYRLRDWRVGALFLALMGAAIIVTASSTSLLLLALSVGAFYYHHRQTFQRALLPLIGAAATAFCAILVWRYSLSSQFSLPTLFAAPDRINVWRLAYHWWKEDVASVLIGHGLGSVRFTLPAIQHLRGVGLGAGESFIWVHNDWLQTLVELGAVGFVLTLLCAYRLVTISRTRLVYPLVGYGVLMCTQFPCHWEAMQLFGIVLVGATLEQAHLKSTIKLALYPEPQYS